MAITEHHRFIEPLDVLFLRGNKLFGDPGSFGESLVPPWPSVVAGALRSAMLANEGVDLAAFANNQIGHPLLGTPERPGPFAIAGFTLARRVAEGRVETLHALPSDLIVEADDQGRAAVPRLLRPVAPAAGLLSSAPLALWPALAQQERRKPVSGLWLAQPGWADYLAGRTPKAEHLVMADDLWKFEPRVGVGLDSATRRAADGRLFTVQAVAFNRDVGFLATVAGAEPPATGVLRLGGDGRGAAVQGVRHEPARIDLAAISKARRARIVLTTPGLFPDGWQLPGVGSQQRVQWPGLSARLVCAAVPRGDVVSGWDIAARCPKTAEQAAPAGSVYWLDDLDATPEALRKLADRGLWPEDTENSSRRAEGFNRFSFAAW
jgi:CRISPR-associated protein Cmr3